MRADRLLSLLWILKARGSITAAAAAEELAVSPRTVLRDVESLSLAGIPVHCLPGRYGGIHLDPGFRVDVTGMTPDECQALFASTAAEGARDLGLHDALSSARRKLTAALPRSSRDAVDLIASRVVIDVSGWLPGQRPHHLDTLQRAVMADRRVVFGYRSTGATASRQRTIDAYGLVCSAGTWYLAGASLDGDVRFYHLARISSVEMLDGEFKRPTMLDLCGLWEDSRSRFRSQFSALSVDAYVRPSRIGELLSLTERIAIGSRSRTARNSIPGYIRAALSFSDRSHALEVLRIVGADALVIEPSSLQDQIRAEASAITTAYESLPLGAGAIAGLS